MTNAQFTLVELLRAGVHRLAEYHHQLARNSIPSIPAASIVAVLNDIGPLMLEAIKVLDLHEEARREIAVTPPSVTSPRLMTPEAYHAVLASDMSESDIFDLIERSMMDALRAWSPGFRVSVPLAAIERAKVMLKDAGWSTPVVHMGDVVAQIVAERPPPMSTLGVFLLGDAVVIAEDVKAARRAAILAAEAAPVTPMWSAYAGGLLAAGDARQVDSSEVLTVYMWGEDGGTSVTHTAAEWVSAGWCGVIGPLDDSDLAAKICAARVHRPECDGVPCYCGEGEGEVAGPEDDVEGVLGSGVSAATALSRLLNEARRDLVRLTGMIGDAGREIGVPSDGRPALDFFPEVLAKTKADARLYSAHLVNEAYRQRNAMVCVAAQLASDAGLHAGLLVDEAGEPGFKTVVAIDLGHPPDGANQITFHMDDRDPTKPWSGLPPYGGEWDGHSDIVKWARIASYLDSDHRATGISAAAQPHLYFVGPYLYVADDGEDAWALHTKMVVASEARLAELTASVGDAWYRSEVTEHVNVLRTLLHAHKSPDCVRDDAEVASIVTDSGILTLTVDDWIGRGKGFMGVTLSYYDCALRPHLEAAQP